MNKCFTFLLLLFGLTVGSGLNAQTTIIGNATITFGTPGDFDIIIPPDCTADIAYEIWGGGGAGGFINTANANTPRRAAPGGSGGGYSTGTTTQGAGTYTVTVGAGGILTNTTTAKANGLASSVFGFTSGGGRGGGATNPGPGGTGNVAGGVGGLRDGNATSGIGGGGGGGSGPVVTNGANAVVSVGGAGGSPNGGDGADAGGDGSDGIFPGGGGGGKGAGGIGLGGLVSGNGADGQVILVVSNYACTVLPVELVSFNAFLNDKEVTLRWQTASEENNEGFEIQKSSNGRDWEVLDWVKGNGTTYNVNGYNFIDKTPFTGNNYYRLKQIDYDGEFEFSNVVTLQYDVKNVVVEVSPNPSPGDVNLTVLNPDNEMMNIVLYDSAGLLIWKSDNLSNLDIWEKEFNLTQTGLHFVRVQIGREFYMKKILILD